MQLEQVCFNALPALCTRAMRYDQERQRAVGRGACLGCSLSSDVVAAASQSYLRPAEWERGLPVN
jgi:hypothetical protein